MDHLVQLIGIISAAAGLTVIIRKEMRDSERHRWDREDRDNREL